jgi:hypothetical protein
MKNFTPAKIGDDKSESSRKQIQKQDFWRSLKLGYFLMEKDRINHFNFKSNHMNQYPSILINRGQLLKFNQINNEENRVKEKKTFETRVNEIFHNNERKII